MRKPAIAPDISYSQLPYKKVQGIKNGPIENGQSDYKTKKMATVDL